MAGMIRLRSAATTGPAVFASRLDAAILAILPARSRRAVPKRASASATVPGPRSWRASSTASSIAMEAPWPAPAGWAASPISTMPSPCHRRTGASTWCSVAACTLRAPRRIATAWRSRRNTAASSPGPTAVRSSGGTFADTWADHQVVPSGAGR